MTKLAPTEGFDVNMDLDEIEVISWCPNTLGENPTQVWMMIKAKSLPAPIIVRFKSARAIDEIIDALIKHADDVFGKGNS